MNIITLNGHDLLELLALAYPDHETDPEQLDTEVCLFQKREAFEADDGSIIDPGLYAYMAEYPEEGIYRLDGEAEESTQEVQG